MSNTTKSQVNPNFQIPKRKDEARLVVLGVWDLFGSIGMYLDFGFYWTNTHNFI